MARPKPIAREIRQLATKRWAVEIRYRLRLDSFLKTEAVIAGKDPDDPALVDKVSGKFYDYFKNRIPRPSTINQIDQLETLAGTKQIFDWVLWKILDNPTASLSEVHSLMQVLDRKLYRHLFKNPRSRKPAIRRCLTSEIQIYTIGRISTEEALAALLLLLRETELTEQWYLYIALKWEILNIITRMATFRPFGEIAVELTDVIYERFIQRNHPLEDYIDIEPQYRGWPLYRGPPRCPDVIEMAERNTHIVSLAVLMRELKPDKASQLDYLFLVQQFEKRDMLLEEEPPEEYFETD